MTTKLKHVLISLILDSNPNLSPLVVGQLVDKYVYRVMEALNG